jgi:hypothetical protein
MKDFRPLHHFLGVSVQHQAGGLFLTQCQFALNILERAGMVDCKPVSPPVDKLAKVSAESGSPIADPTHFRSLAGALQYLTFTRPDIAYTVQQICLHIHDPREPHLTAMKHTLRYLRGTLDYGLLLRLSATSELTVYTDADWAGCPDTRRSTSGYALFLGANLVSWSSKRRNVVSLECRGRVPGCGQWRGGGLLAAIATSGASCSANEEHPHLLRQRQHRLSTNPIQQ